MKKASSIKRLVCAGEVSETLVSLPAAAARCFTDLAAGAFGGVFAASDPEGMQLGSGSGAAWLLDSAWRRSGSGHFREWLAGSRKLLIQGGGESRRLPCCGPRGKPLLPLPVVPNSPGQRPFHSLLDLQLQSYGAIVRAVHPECRVVVACGDVLLRHSTPVPRCPCADIVIAAVRAAPAEASRHGVVVSRLLDAEKIAAFLHKPAISVLRALGKGSTFRLDAGVWMLSEKAVMHLMRKSGWNPGTQSFINGIPERFDLYGELGPAIGRHRADGMTSAMLPLDGSDFLHFGANRAMISSVLSLVHAGAGEKVSGTIFNSRVSARIPESAAEIWIENSHVGKGWKLSRQHVLTGIPGNDWMLELAAGECIDIAPVNNGGNCVRCYGFEDDFRGRLFDVSTLWLGRPAREWFDRRGITPAEAGLDPGADIFDSRIFPVVEIDPCDGRFVRWLLHGADSARGDCRALWLGAKRLSARELLRETDLVAQERRRYSIGGDDFAGTGQGKWARYCGTMDLGATAGMVARGLLPRLTVPVKRQGDSLLRLHDCMFKSAVSALLGRAGESAEEEARAFGLLRDMIVGRIRKLPSLPSRNVLEDQIVWGRSPARLDLAGGWTDTPPYCIEYGGTVVNVAVDMNGQPPIQVFGRLCEEPVINLRSVDLGIGKTITTYEELRQFGPLGGGFCIAKAALILAGFDPAFGNADGPATLRELLRSRFGGGLDLTMLAAIPKGSGLGTSSILAATILGTLNEMCRLEWKMRDIMDRTMVLEQMLTSGGGWQDQVGGLAGGLKVIRTLPGLPQKPEIENLDPSFFRGGCANKRVLLYYTGLTRIAHDILDDIVGGLFLNSSRHIGIIREIGMNAEYAAGALRRPDWPSFCDVIRRSWRLNQELDEGTNPAQVRSIIGQVADYIEACKLLGAGGGGYMLFLAKDDKAAEKIRKKLLGRPQNNKARFVDISVSDSGFRVTKS